VGIVFAIVLLFLASSLLKKRLMSLHLKRRLTLASDLT